MLQFLAETAAAVVVLLELLHELDLLLQEGGLFPVFLKQALAALFAVHRHEAVVDAQREGHGLSAGSAAVDQDERIAADVGRHVEGVPGGLSVQEQVLIVLQTEQGHGDRGLRLARVGEHDRVLHRGTAELPHRQDHRTDLPREVEALAPVEVEVPMLILVQDGNLFVHFLSLCCVCVFSHRSPL